MTRFKLLTGKLNSVGYWFNTREEAIESLGKHGHGIVVEYYKYGENIAYQKVPSGYIYHANDWIGYDCYAKIIARKNIGGK